MRGVAFDHLPKVRPWVGFGMGGLSWKEEKLGWGFSEEEFENRMQGSSIIKQIGFLYRASLIFCPSSTIIVERKLLPGLTVDGMAGQFCV